MRSTWLGSKPGSALCAMLRLRTKSPAQLRSSSERATWTITRPLDKRDFERPPEVFSASSFKTETGDTLDARSAGMRPEIVAVKNETNMGTSITVRSLCPLSTNGNVVDGTNPLNEVAVHAVSARAAPPPAKAMTRFRSEEHTSELQSR